MKVYFRFLLVLCALFHSFHQAFAKEYIIFSITQEVPMGRPHEKLQKNYYLNMGHGQGLKIGDIVDIYRTVSQSDPYNQNKRFDFHLKIGQIKIIHSEENAAIGERLITEANNQQVDKPYLDIKEFMIGDNAEVSVGI